MSLNRDFNKPNKIDDIYGSKTKKDPVEILPTALQPWILCSPSPGKRLRNLAFFRQTCSERVIKSTVIMCNYILSYSHYWIFICSWTLHKLTKQNMTRIIFPFLSVGSCVKIRESEKQMFTAVHVRQKWRHGTGCHGTLPFLVTKKDCEQPVNCFCECLCHTPFIHIHCQKDINESLSTLKTCKFVFNTRVLNLKANLKILLIVCLA